MSKQYKRSPKSPPPKRKKFMDLLDSKGFVGLEKYWGRNMPASEREPWRSLPMSLRPRADALLHERLQRYPPEKHRYVKGLIMANIVSHLRGQREPKWAYRQKRIKGLRRYRALIEMGLAKEPGLGRKPRVRFWETAPNYLKSLERKRERGLL